MRRVSAQQATDTDDRIILTCLSQRARRGRNLKRARNAHQMNVLLFRAGAYQPVVCTLKESLRDEGIEARDDNCKASASSAQTSFDRTDRGLGRNLDLQAFFLEIPRN